MLKIIRITGVSLTPEYQPGDYVLVAGLARYAAGDVVVFERGELGMLIKRVERVLPETDALYVVGSHPLSVDSRQFGPIPRGSVLGKVLWHIRRPMK